MSTTIAPGAAAGSGAAPARGQAAVASASRAGQARGSVPRPDNHVIVVFGATGDLAHRKLLPGLFHLATAGLMPDRYQIVGVSPQDMTSKQFRDLARQAAAIMVHGCTGVCLPSIWGTQSQSLLGSPSVASMVGE
jgi:hypothetical protein